MRRWIARWFTEPGICGVKAPRVYFVPDVLYGGEVCTLKAGHRGWHHNHPSGMDWGVARER